MTVAEIESPLEEAHCVEGMRVAGVRLSLIAQIGQYKKNAGDQDIVKAVSSINSPISHSMDRNLTR